jgi:hypothetical protein
MGGISISSRKKKLKGNENISIPGDIERKTNAPNNSRSKGTNSQELHLDQLVEECDEDSISSIRSIHTCDTFDEGDDEALRGSWSEMVLESISSGWCSK